MNTSKLVLILTVSAALNGFCADTNATTATKVVSYAPAVLPGKGLAQHPFFYTGEWDYRKANQTIFVVRGGHVVWTYSIYKGRSNNRPRNAA
jgi:hypothetical protein